MRLPVPFQHIGDPSGSVPHDLMGESIRLFDKDRVLLRNDILKMPDFMMPTVWVSKNIRLAGNQSQREGWLKFTGYQRAIADAFMCDECTDITILKATRVGWSMFIAAMAAYFVGYLGEAITIAQPTDDAAELFAKEVIEPMIECCAALKDQRLPGTLTFIQFANGGSIRLVGATSDDNFRRYGSKRNFGDEYSASGWASKKGGPQGDKATNFKERGGEYWHTTLALGSTPLSKEDCRTFARWEKSDQRYPYILCPHCGTQQIMEWGDRDTPFGFKWACDETTGFVKEAWYQCSGAECISIKRRITETDKWAIDETMEYLPTSVSTTPGHWGFHIPQWLSFAGQASWKKITQAFLSAQGDPEKLKNFTNNQRGWVWDEYTTSAVEPKTLKALLVPYVAEVPDDVVVLTAGGDTQDNKEGSILEQVQSRELQVVGWNRHGQFRVIGHWTIFGEPGDRSSDLELRALLDRTFYKRDGKPMKIAAAAIDLGSNTRGVADATRLFCNSFPLFRNIWAIKGNSHRKDFEWPKLRSKNKNSGTYYSIDSHLSRDAIFKLVQYAGDKVPMVPLALGEAFIDKLVCQERYRKDGRYHWRDKKGSRAEEQWMCLAYAHAALKGLQASYAKKWKDLNLAADTLRIPETNHDPITGEVMYSGVDKSAPATERLNAVVPLDAPEPQSQLARSRPLKEHIVNNRVADAAPTPPKTKIKRFKTGRVG